MLAIVDAGPLYAAADADDDDHERCVAVLARGDLELIVPDLVVAEATYLIGSRLGARAEAVFLRVMKDWHVETPERDDWMAMARLVERYGDFPLGGTDAFVSALADRMGTNRIVTLDRRHFAAIRSSSGRPYQLLPD